MRESSFKLKQLSSQDASIATFIPLLDLSRNQVAGSNGYAYESVPSEKKHDPKKSDLLGPLDACADTGITLLDGHCLLDDFAC